MSDEQNMTEEEREAEEVRQEKLEAGVGEIIPGAGRRGTPRRMDQMVSVRLSGDLIARLKIVARRRNLTLSELVRKGAEQVVEEPYTATQSQIKFRISGTGTDEASPAESDHEYVSDDLLAVPGRLG